MTATNTGLVLPISNGKRKSDARVVSTNWIDNLYPMDGVYIRILRCMRPLTLAHMAKSGHVCATRCCYIAELAGAHCTSVANAAYLALLCNNSTRKSFRLNNSSGVELPPIMGSPTAVNARDDIVGPFSAAC